jgi:hypothetical protein
VRSSAKRKQILEDAWIGDAVLSLYARLRILRGGGSLDGETFERMTSNHFLAVFGEPSEVEAELGRLFERDGLDAAFQWIDQKLIPTFERQEENRARRSGSGR